MDNGGVGGKVGVGVGAGAGATVTVGVGRVRLLCGDWTQATNEDDAKLDAALGAEVSTLRQQASHTEGISEACSTVQRSSL